MTSKPQQAGDRLAQRIEEVLVLGAGTMGREIALQCAMFGYRVTLYDISAEALRGAKAAHDEAAPTLAESYVPDDAAAIVERIYYTTRLEEAAASADLVSESAPEDPEVKRRLFTQLHALAPPQAVFTTNSSSLAPSTLAAATGRPGRFLALHFHQTVWISNLVDVMPHPGTQADVVDLVTAFARSIGQIPIVIPKETPSYVFNAMLQGYMDVAVRLWLTEVASFEDIDRAWMIAERADHGPFGVMDFVGIDTIYDIMRWRAIETDDAGVAVAAERLKTDFLDRGRLGLKTNQGFYDYPNPAFREPDFLTRGSSSR